MVANVTRFGQADLTDCDRETIRIPGSIQPHGLLLALDPTTLKVVQLAGDTKRLLGLTVAELIEKDLGSHLGSAASLQVEHLVRNDELLPRPFFVVGADVAGEVFDVCAHLSGSLVVLELEKRHADLPQDGIALVQKMMGSVEAATDLVICSRPCYARYDKRRASTGSCYTSSQTTTAAMSLLRAGARTRSTVFLIALPGQRHPGPGQGIVLQLLDTLHPVHALRGRTPSAVRESLNWRTSRPQLQPATQRVTDPSRISHEHGGRGVDVAVDHHRW